jgi:pimeloyl-ACP methyl ester carboxylesterase
MFALASIHLKPRPKSLSEFIGRGTSTAMRLAALFITLFSFSAYAFVEEEVHFPVGNGILLTGYLSRPDSAGPHPALIMQMGSGQGTTDSKTRKYNPFADMARKLSDDGFVVLRFDKRGTGYNSANGSFEDATFVDYVDDLKSAINSVQQRGDVSTHEIFLFGHSLGGPVVSIAARDISDVKGIILSASPGRSYADFNFEQTKYLLEWGHGFSGAALDAEMVKVKRADDLINQPNLFCLEFPNDCQIKKGQTYLWGQSAQFWKEIAALDPLESLRSLGCKIFAINGTSDWVISSDNDGGAIGQALSGNTSFSRKVLKGLDHFLLNVESKKADVELFSNGLKDENLQIHSEYIPEISSILKDWIRSTP